MDTKNLNCLKNVLDAKPELVEQFATFIRINVNHQPQPTPQPKAPKKPKAFSDQLREAIRNSESSCYAIHKATGIDQAVLSKFLSGERGMLMPSIDALVEFLSLELVERKG